MVHACVYVLFHIMELWKCAERLMYFNGTQVIFSWILMFALYFVPYALMVGELGSAFKNSGRRCELLDP